MNLLLDTNIILFIIRSKNYEGIVNFINPHDALVYLSIVSEAEIKSIALRNKWGSKRRSILDSFLDNINIVEANHMSVNIYAEIDAFSQRSNPNFEKYAFGTPRNMGKNDLWIASLAALLSLKLVTTDSDFDHLNGVFFNVQKVYAKDMMAF